MSSKYEAMLKNKQKKCPKCGSENVGTVLDHDSKKEGWYCPSCNHEFDMTPFGGDATD